MDTIADIDARLTHALEAYRGALDAGQLHLADLAYQQLDSLLELRCHLPQQAARHD